MLRVSERDYTNWLKGRHGSKISLENDVRERLKELIIDEVEKRTGESGVKEYLFAKPERKWRSDIAWPSKRIALEINGGIYSYGRHNRASGYLKDLEKGNGYASRGWLLFQTPWEWIEDDETRDSMISDIAHAINSRKEEFLNDTEEKRDTGRKAESPRRAGNCA